ncbi:MAG: hypothetical protein CMJ87_03960, partial [Planctomycetes bacterium]|nr:hypothetical protein [Planctomycetota bacterium]
MKLFAVILCLFAFALGACTDNFGSKSSYYRDGRRKFEGSECKEHGGFDRAGFWTFWHDNGQKWAEGYYNSDADSQECGVPEGHWTYWYKNGQKWAECEYADCAEECSDHSYCCINSGTWTFWHGNGQKWGEGEYICGVEEGPWTYWDENGQKWGEGEYKKGKKEGP